MIAFPDVQRKTQAKIDEVVGHGKLPKFVDYECLPYIHTLVKETAMETCGPSGPPSPCDSG
jgi:hypothetical protein